MKQYLSVKIIIGVILAAFAIYFAVETARKSIEKYVVNSRLLTREYEVVGYWTQLSQIRQEAEINQLNYVLTGKNKYLQAYEGRKKQLIQNVKKLDRVTEPEWQEYAEIYKNLIDKKIQFMDRSNEKRSIDRLEAMQILFEGEGRSTAEKLDELRESLRSELTQSVQKKLEVSLADVARAKSSLQSTYLLSILICIIVGAVLLFDLKRRSRYEKALVEAEADAVRASQFKSQFLAHMSHEIRTPLNSIIAMGDLLAEGELKESQRNLVSTLIRASDSLLRIVNEVLDFAKIEAGAMTLESLDFSLVGLVTDVRNIAAPKAQQKNLSLIIENNLRDEARALGDPGRLQQVLLNLVMNAIKFTEKGKVKIAMFHGEGPWVRFEVSDTGIGMSREVAEKLFKPFQQAEVSTSRVYGGTGLGLVISKQIVELMGGAIRVQSELGKGTVFSFEVPVLNLNAKTILLTETKDREAESVAKQLIPTNWRILVADDVKENRDLLYLYLKSYGHQFEFAENGLQAVEKFKTGQFDLVLMDMQMPVRSGYHAVKDIRSYELETKRSATPIIALTAQAFQNEKDESIKAGCNMHVTKPIKKQILLNAMSEIYALMNQKSA